MAIRQAQIPAFPLAVSLSFPAKLDNIALLLRQTVAEPFREHLLVAVANRPVCIFVTEQRA